LTRSSSGVGKWKALLLLLVLVVVMLPGAQAETKAESRIATLYRFIKLKYDGFYSSQLREDTLEMKVMKDHLRMLQEVEAMNTTDPDVQSKNGTENGNKLTAWQRTIEGLGYSFFFILLSEIGDKTFLFIVLYATRMNGIKLFIVSTIGICSMHILGVAVGDVFQYILSPFWLKLITVVSFFIFGVVLIYMGITEEPDTEDLEEKLKEIEVEMIDKKSKLMSDYDNESAQDPDKPNQKAGESSTGVFS